MKQKQKTLWGVPVKLWRVLIIVSVTLMTELIVAATTPTPSSPQLGSLSQSAVPTAASTTSLDAIDVVVSSSEYADDADESSESESEIAVMSYITAIDDTTNVDDLVVDCAAISGTVEVHIPETETDDEEGDLEEDSDTSKEGRMLFPPEWWGDTRMSYMDYRTITDPSSDQWRLQQKAVTDPVTGIRTVNGRYCVAVGSAISMVKGAYIDVTLQNGVRIPCVLSDCKRDGDTMDTFVGADGGIVEFVVDTNSLPSRVQLLGSNEAQFNGYWASPVKEIFVWDESSNGYYDW